MKILKNMEKEEKKEKKILLIIVPLILIIILLLVYILFFSTKETPTENESLKISGIQIVQEKNDINNETSVRKTRILGDNLNAISKEHPYVYLKNDESNHVYLQFKVFVNENQLYSSDLIEPGKMEKLDIYSLLSKGNHKLEYQITSYSLDEKEILLSGIKQLKDITIS